MAGKPLYNTPMKKWASKCTQEQADNIQQWTYTLGFNQQSEYFRSLANPAELYDILKEHFGDDQTPD